LEHGRERMRWSLLDPAIHRPNVCRFDEAVPWITCPFYDQPREIRRVDHDVGVLARPERSPYPNVGGLCRLHVVISGDAPFAGPSGRGRRTRTPARPRCPATRPTMLPAAVAPCMDRALVEPGARRAPGRGPTTATAVPPTASAVPAHRCLARLPVDPCMPARTRLRGRESERVRHALAAAGGHPRARPARVVAGKCPV